MACRTSILFALLLSAMSAVAQGKWAAVNEAEYDSLGRVTRTFRATRLVNLHTTELMPKGSLDFRIAHRFGAFRTKLNNLYGLDGPATIQFRLDYSITDRLTVGIGRSSYKKMGDVFIKYKWFHQKQTGMPVSVALLASTNVIMDSDPTANITGLDRYAVLSNRLVYFFHGMVSRKFGPRFSAQLSPMLVHYNLVEKLNDKNDILAIGYGARYKALDWLSVTAEYVQRTFRYSPDFRNYHNVLSLGVDLETSGHVFQVFVTNGYMINEAVVIPFTDGTWSDGNMMLGFNISRTFDVLKK
ncbi:MAG: DUF5777 family beta-barrel protein [Cyclobacteriaceae bacterium]